MSKESILLTFMVLRNFKSYANEQRIGPFHQCFTAVVGPNGSGKSNVIDALLFVFGYRASKMRQGKLSELIYQSANAAEQPDHCTVELHFKVTQTMIDDEELVISRTAYRNNSSKYFINGNNSTYGQVTELLKSFGVDLEHKRFLILQGEVESIALMKPKAQNDQEEGLLEYLEDIIGTTHYKPQIDQLDMQIHGINDERVQRLDRVKMMEKQRDTLKEGKEKAEAFIRSENEMIKLQHQVLQRQIFEASTKQSQAQLELNTLSTNLHAHREAFQSRNTEIEAKSAILSKMQNDLKSLEALLEKDSKKNQELERSLAKLKEQYKHFNLKKNKLSSSLEKDNNSYSQAEHEWKNLTGDIQEIEVKVNNLKSTLEKEEAILAEIQDGLKGKTQTFIDQIQVQQNALQPWKEQISQEKQQIALLTSQKEVLLKKSQQDEKAYHNAQNDLEVSKSRQVEKVSEFKQSEEVIKNTQEKVAALEQQLKKILKEEEDFRQKYEQVKSRYQEAISTARTNKSRNTVYQFIIKMRDSGRVRGIYDRLGNLGRINDKYDVAISTACRMLDHVVVENADVATDCIQHLKKNNVGRASFICLDKQQNRMEAARDTPENVPRLVDLIEPTDQRFRIVFSNVLHGTLVCENMNQANRIAFGSGRRNHRVVTLAGELIEKSGTMSGGGGQVNRGGMRLSMDEELSAEDLEKLKAQQEQAEISIIALRSERENLQKQISQLQRGEIPSLEMQAKKLQMEIENLSKQQEELTRYMEKISTEHSEDHQGKKKMEEISRELSKKEKLLSDKQLKASEIESQIKHLEEKILQVGGIKLRAQNAKVEGIKEQISSFSERVIKMQVQAEKVNYNGRKLQEEIVQKKEELHTIEVELENLTAQGKQVEDHTVKSRKIVEDLEKKVIQEREKVDEASKLLESEEEAINEFRVKESLLVSKINEAKGINKEESAKLLKLNFRMSELTLHPIAEGDGMEDFVQLTEQEISRLNLNKTNQQINAIKEKLQKERPNLGIIEEYQLKHQEYLKRVKDLDDLTSTRDTKKQELDMLRQRRLEEFMTGLNNISSKLKEIYQTITLGGNAELELVDSLDPFSGGIEFTVMPPRKSWKNISNLSGGEKTLSSLALVFALHHFKPNPIYVMDEIDAALDFRNVSIVANYIKERTENAQFVVISLRNNMFELADRLVGVYKIHNETKSVTLNPKQVILNH